MLKNYNDKYKAHLDGVVREKLNPSMKQENQESGPSKLSKLKKFACTLDFERKSGDTKGSK